MNDPPDGYPIADITLPPHQARHIIDLLLDVHGVLDHLYLDGTNPDLSPPPPRTTCAAPPASTRWPA